MDNIFAVDETLEQIEQDDAALAESNTENDVVGLAEAVSDEEHPEAQEQQTEEQTTEKPKESAQAKEPAWYRRQLTAERNKWNQEKADYEARLAAYAEKELEAEAEKLAAEENCSKNFALRLLRAERGLPAQEKAPEAKATQQPRTADGRFAKAEPTAEDPVRTRAEALLAQNETVLKATGVDALALYQQNEKVREKVNSGEWDFADVAKAYLEETKGRRVPSPVRHANSGSLKAVSIENMSDAQWEKLNRELEMGRVIDPTR